MKIEVCAVLGDRAPPQFKGLVALREWCWGSAGADFAGELERVVREAGNLELAVKRALDPGRRVVVALGMPRDELDAALAEANIQPGPAFEVLHYAPEAGAGAGRWPLADGLEAPGVVSTPHLIPALRKALIRLRTARIAEIRPLRSEAELEAYFALRYRVWKELDYLPPERDCAQSGWELDFTDRTARPIGAFAGGELVGCARLVHQVGVEDAYYLPRIEQMAAANGDARLLRNWAYPRVMSHPFDLLESFEGFRSYYRRLVARGRPVAELSRVIVDPDARLRGLGLGEALVDSITSLALREKVDELILACRDEHRGFYERCGFRALPGIRCDRFALVNVPAIAMVRSLGTEEGRR